MHTTNNTPPRGSYSLRDGGDWLTADDAWAYLGLPSRKALYQAVRRGQIPVHRLGPRRLRFRKTELDRLILNSK